MDSLARPRLCWGRLQTSVSQDDIRRAVRHLGLSGRAVCVHSSLQSFGHVSGGPDAVVDAFLTEGSTVVVPTFTWALGVPPPPHLRYRRNGWDYRRDVSPTTGVGRNYMPATLEIEKEMGAVAAAVVARPGRARGNHPLCSFSAIGPLAGQIVQNQRPDDVFAPLQALAQSGGHILLMGLNLRRLTLIHLAEKLSGRTLLRRWANDATGEAIAMEVGGHSRGFEALRPHLPCLQTYQVGSSQWILCAGPEAPRPGRRSAPPRPGHHPLRVPGLPAVQRPRGRRTDSRWLRIARPPRLRLTAETGTRRRKHRSPESRPRTAPTRSGNPSTRHISPSPRAANSRYDRFQMIPRVFSSAGGAVASDTTTITAIHHTHVTIAPCW